MLNFDGNIEVDDATAGEFFTIGIMTFIIVERVLTTAHRRRITLSLTQVMCRRFAVRIWYLIRTH